MRFIDADALKKDDEVRLWLSNDAVRTGKTLKMFSELFVKKIDEQPTIQAVPIDVFDKLRAEITNYKLSEDMLKDMDEDSIKWGMAIAIELLDKYKAEQEG